MEANKSVADLVKYREQLKPIVAHYKKQLSEDMGELVRSENIPDDSFEVKVVMHEKSGMPAFKVFEVFYPRCACKNDNMQHIGGRPAEPCHFSQSEWDTWNGLCAFQE